MGAGLSRSAGTQHMSVDISNSAATAGLDPSRVRIAGAIKQAANTTGISFEYLLATAKMESNFNPKAAASTSSARGLYQFIDQTWLGTVKEAGSRLGYGKYAAAISKSSSGSYYVNNSAAYTAIMKLRDDPNPASAIAKDARTAFAALRDAPARLAFASATQPAMTIDNAAYLSSFPDSRAVTPVTAATQTQLKTASLPQQDPISRPLFQAGEPTQPISPAGRGMWGNSSALTSGAVADSVSVAAAGPSLSHRK